MEKSELRGHLLSKRKEISFKSLKSAEICRIFLESEIYKNCDKIYIYCSIGSEVDTLAILKKALCDGKRVALPRCLDIKGNMKFYYIKNDSDLISGAFGIKEPSNDCKEAVFDEKTVCIVPGIAFSFSGFRLGYGKGYYDRFLSDFKGVSVGFCFEECVEEKLPHDKYDMKVNCLITDKRIYNFT